MARIPGFNDESAPDYRALLVPDPRVLDVWEAESSYTAAGIQPSIPVPQQDTPLTLRASGTLDTDAVPIDFTLTRNGFPARDLGARIAIRRSDQTPEEEWRAHWAAHLPVSQEAVGGLDENTFDAGVAPSITGLVDGGLVAAWSNQKAGGVTWEVRASPRSDGEGWSSISNQLFGWPVVEGDGPAAPLTAIASLPTGRIILIVATSPADSVVGPAGSFITFDAYVSDDGKTWDLNTFSCVPPLDAERFVLRKMQMAYGGAGELLLVTHLDDAEAAVRDDVLYQWASADFAASFVLVDAQDGGGNRNGAPRVRLRASGGHSVVATRTGFVIAYAEPNDEDVDATLGVLYTRTLSSAFTPFSSVEAVQVASSAGGGVVASGPGSWTVDISIAITADRNGTLWVYWRQANLPADETGMNVSLSTDGGTVWGPAGTGSFPAPAPVIAAAVRFYQMAAAWDRGRVFLLHTLNTGASYDNLITATIFGGWSAVNAPLYFTGLDDSDPLFSNAAGSLASQAAPNYWQLGWALPDLLGWTHDDSAAPGNAESVNGQSIFLRCDPAPAFNGWSALIPADPSSDPRVVNGFYDVVASSGFTGIHIAGTPGGGGGTAKLSCWVSPDAIELYDGGGLLASAVVSPLNRVQVAISSDSGDSTITGATPKCAAWYRVITANSNEPTFDYDPPWVLLFEGACGTYSGSAEMRFGVPNIPSEASPARPGQSTANIFSAMFWHGNAAGQNPNDLLYPRTWSDGRPAVVELQGRAATVIPEHALDGLYFAAVGGPGFTGDEWVHSPIYDFGPDSLSPLVSRSPSEGWKGLDGTEAAFAWDLTSGAADNSYLESPVLGIHVKDTNRAVWRVELYIDGVGWQLVEDFDTTETFGILNYDRRGSAAILKGVLTAQNPLSVDGDIYLTENELVGGLLYSITQDAAWEITKNTGGLVTDATTPLNSRSPRVFLADATGDEVAPVAGCKIVPPSFTYVLQLDGYDSSAIRGIRLTALGTGYDTLSRASRIGKAIVGAVHVFGISYDNTTTTSRRSAVDVDQDASGQVYTRKRGPTRRVVDVGWTQEGGIWTGQLYKEGADGFALLSQEAGAWAVSSLHEIPVLVDGLFDQLDGPNIPVVLLQDLPRLPAGASSEVLGLFRARSAIYGHLTSDVTLSSDDFGTADTDQQLTISMQIQEEV